METRQDKPKGEGLGVRGPQDEVGKGARARKVREELVDDEGGGGNSTEEIPGRVHQMIGLATGPGRRTSRQSKRGGVYPCCEVFRRRTKDGGENATRARRG